MQGMASQGARGSKEKPWASYGRVGKALLGEFRDWTEFQPQVCHQLSGLGPL